MESKINTGSNPTIYEKISNSWTIIFDFLDINSLFQSENVSKFFRKQMLLYYESKEGLSKINKNDSNEKENENKIKSFKKQFLSKYFNLLVHINISGKKFCNENTNQTENEDKFELEKISYPKSESIFFKNRNQIEQISKQNNKFLILYNTNFFSIIEFDTKDKNQKYNEVFSYDFQNEIIQNFKYYENDNETVIFFIKKNSTEFYALNLNEKEIKNYDLKKEYNISNEENLIIKNIFTFIDFILILTNKDEFILIPNENLKITKNKTKNKKTDTDNDEDKKSDEENKNDDLKEDNIIYPKKLENNYGSIKYIYSNNSNVIILNNDCQLYSIPALDYKNYEKQIPKFKLFTDQKFPDFYTMSGSNNFFLLLEKEKIKPLEEWNSEEVYKWFEEMELDDYLNIIKYQKISGKDIIEGGKYYLLDTMGILEDHLNKVNYEISTLKFETSKNMKLWGWGNNKNGQLGLINYQNFVKVPTQINLPNMMPDDTIEKIFCGKTYTVLLTKFGNLFVTGNYSVKEQANTNQKNNNNHGKKNKGKNKHLKDEHKEKDKKGDKNKEKDKNKDKSKDNENNINNNYVENKWINISNNICYCSYKLFEKTNKNENSYFKVKDIFCEENSIFFIGFYSNTIPFFAIQRKPKFKHLKKGGKFITSDKVIEHIQKFLKDKIPTFRIVYGDSLLKMLETPLDDYLESEIPFHKIIQIKDNNEIIWDRKKRYFKESFIKENINK